MWYVNTRPNAHLGASLVLLCELRTVVREHCHHKSAHHRGRCLGATSRHLFGGSFCAHHKQHSSSEIESPLCRVQLVGNSNAMHEISKSRLGTYGVEARVYLEINQHVGMFSKSLLHRFEGLIVLAKADINQREFILIHVAMLGFFLQQSDCFSRAALVPRNRINMSDVA